ncbi:hypothetical protein Bbelb_230540 [Branchiostoma belcheri]|nr:hypothetical protein Bbelb_230540 [Branchiostoma belcheri]
MAGTQTLQHTEPTGHTHHNSARFWMVSAYREEHRYAPVMVTFWIRVDHLPTIVRSVVCRQGFLKSCFDNSVVCGAQKMGDVITSFRAAQTSVWTRQRGQSRRVQAFWTVLDV